MGNQVFIVSQLQALVHQMEPSKSFSGRHLAVFGKAGKTRICLDLHGVPPSTMQPKTIIDRSKNNSPNYLILTAEMKSPRLGDEFVKLQKHCFGLLIKEKQKQKQEKIIKQANPMIYI